MSFALRRLILAALLVWVGGSAAFVLTRLAPGDATVVEGEILGDEERQEQRRLLGLDQPILVQYARWVAGGVRLDLGTSSLYSRPVRDLLGERLINTAVLAAAALALATALGIPLGIYTAARPRHPAARAARLLSILLLSTPPLVSALVLVLIAARTGWAPTGGMSSGTAGSWWAHGVDLARHLPVPALALALPLVAALERLQSQSLAESLQQPFVQAAGARGLSEGGVVMRHAWPVSIGSLLGLYGLMIGALFSGSFVVEVVTAWPGLGRLMVDALRARDLYLAAGTAAAGAACLAVATLAADIAHAALDPRLREAS